MQDRNGVINAFEEFSKKYRRVIDCYIKSYYEQKIGEAQYDYQKNMFSDIMHYCTREGKRIRPLLVLIAYFGYKKYFRDTDTVSALAATLEIMHSMLLIQDDIVDKSLLRRGQKAIHVIYDSRFKHRNSSDSIGSDVAIILADVMFSNCLDIISSSNVPGRVKDRFLHFFARTYEHTAWGQVLDIINSNKKGIDPEEKNAEHISRMKTAYYTLVYPLLMGYSLTGRKSKNEMACIKQFALPLGMAFQIRDDVLGVFGNEKNLGKPTDSDIQEGKRTLLIENTVSLLKPARRKGFITLFLKKRKSKSDVKKIRNSIVDSRALDKTITQHGQFVAASLENLEKLHIGKQYKNILYGIVETIQNIPL